MGLKKAECMGLAELQSLIEVWKLKEKRIFVLFCGLIDPDTKQSWCSDCNKADPVIEKVALDFEGVLIRCTVGDKASWKDPDNEFRKHPDIKITGIPTLMEWGTHRRFSLEECANEDLVRMLFEED